MIPLTPSQQQAIEARGNVLVVAGAGTGKTSTLVQRCLDLLAKGGSLENILMVTFTEAAAVEMRGRIRAALQDSIKTRESGGRADAGQAEHFRQQLALLDVSLISTLHSFCLQLVRQHFYELGIDPDALVLSEQQTQPLIRRTLDRILERRYAGETDTDRGVRTLVQRHGRGSDERIRAWILKLHQYAQSLADPERWLRKQAAIFSQSQPAQWREWLVESFPAWRDQWLGLLPAYAGSSVVNLALTTLQGLPDRPTLDPITQAMQAIRSADEDQANWPRGSKKSIRNHLADFFEEVNFLASLSPARGTDPLVEDWELARHDMRSLLDLTREFTAEFSRAKREAGGMDFADLEQFALRVLWDSESGAAAPAACQWRRQLHYVFVDEYQDINGAQDKIIEALSRESNPGNRFLVGDVKQSIYRFRLADPGICRGYEKRWKKGEAGSQCLSLADNFRSHPGVLEFVNRLFRALMRETIGGVAYEELRFGDVAGRAVSADPAPGIPPVELQLIVRRERPEAGSEIDDEENAGSSEAADLRGTEREARLVGMRLRELKEQPQAIWDKVEKSFRPVKWGDMAVLLRSPAGRVEAFAMEFARLGIPLEAARGGFFESLEISDLVCLLKLLDNPLQDVPLLAVLRSPLVGMSVAELAEVRARETPEPHAPEFWLAARHFVQRGSPSSSAWRKLDAFYRQLDRWRELLRRTSLSQGLETALTETHYEMLLRALPRGESMAANVRRLLVLAREYDPYQRQGLYRFLRFIEAQEEMEAELKATPASGDAVQLLSIHRSKGLEFPVLAVAGLGSLFNFRDLRENILLDGKFGLCPKIVPADAGRGYPSLPYWLARRRQRQELLGEELRLLYVAMTRARDRLLLIATVPGKADGKWVAAEARELSDRELLSARSPLDWLKLWLPQVTREHEWHGDREGQSRLFGWKIYAEDDPRLALPERACAGKAVNEEAALAADEGGLLALRTRVNWRYPFPTATRQMAKTSVTELRLHREEEEAEAAPFIRRNAFRLPAARQPALTAAEAGVAHHRFLQRVSLSSVYNAEALRGEAERLKQEQWLTAAESVALDFDALAQFWQSDFGRSVAVAAPAVRRELEFTARFALKELQGLPGCDTLAPNSSTADSGAGARLSPASPAEDGEGEFVVVQGRVDLAVLLPKEIRLVDFKTDQFEKNELADKVKAYEPQLKLYARALERIYQRPVTECCLHFLSQRTSVQVQP